MSIYEYESKDQPAALLKFDAGAGSGTCLFSRYFVEDADHDYTKPGFLPHGAICPLLIGHVWSETPVGKGKIRSERDAAYFDFALADTARGKELASWLRFDFSDGQPKSEFSYGFQVLEGGSSRQLIDGKMLRVLHAREDGSPGALVKECSYVLAGSGVGTALVAMKGEQRYRWQRRHAQLTAEIQARQRAQQGAAQALYQRFLTRQKEWQR